MVNRGTPKLGLDLYLNVPDEYLSKMWSIYKKKMYNHVLTAYRHEADYNELRRNPGIDGRKVRELWERKNKLRAAWYNDLKGWVIPKEDVRK